MNIRLIAARILMKVIYDGQSLTTALENAFTSIESAKDKAFIQALCYGVCRNFHRLDFILSELLDKPLKDKEVKILTLAGLYQLAFMRVKSYAAVSETVMAASKKPWAKAVINAILRNYLREQANLELKANNNDSAATSHPDWLVGRIRQDWPEQAQDIFQQNNQQPPMALRVNLAKTSLENYIGQLVEHKQSGNTVGFCPSAIILQRPVAVDLLPGFAEGLVSVQDTAAQMAAWLLDVQAGQRVLDICAAPGGKTSHILEMQPQLKELVAVDIEENRMAQVQDNLQRLGLQATLKVGDASQPDSWWDGQLFDRILLDAPCSATGVIRRHPDIKLLRRADDIDALAQLQQSILRAAWIMLAPGGLLLYATCSIFKQENELQIAAFLADHNDASEQALPATGDGSQWGLARPHGRQVITGTAAMDGFYYALLRKH
ncbi:16S rRNA (cytosine(967)-C(5))-methyltransferase RsmB [Methylosoma difficile]